MELFTIAARESYEQVRAVSETGDAMRVRAEAHGAKGEARNAGVKFLGDLYAALEVKAKVRGPTSDLVAEIAAEVARVEAFAAAYTAQHT